MSVNSNFTSFTITQAFLGAPLQFAPALGSQELEQLVDAYVPGTASKQDKLSEVTIDFYNHATVDLNTGALVKRYDVFLSPRQAFEQSPAQSQSSGFSPAGMYIPSPASSNNIGMTPPTRHRTASRVSKKSATTKKDTKKVAETRLPGFSIMTKDGVDVTSSAGRGTKTKEQREHAHLMRIMKACDDCKRKKIRCDPTHRRQSTEMSRTSTASTSSRQPSSASSSRANPSPTASISSLSHQSSFASQATTPSFTPSSAIDDFVLFPEDAWNPADLSIPEDAELSQFFDLNDINLDIPMNTADFDFSAFDNLQPLDFSDFSYRPFVPQQHPAGLPVPLLRQQASASTQDSENPDLILGDSWTSGHSDAMPHGRSHPSSSSQDSGQSSLFSLSPTTANVSPLTTGANGDEVWPDGLSQSLPRSSGFYSSGQEPASQRSLAMTNSSSLLQQQLSDCPPTDSSPSSKLFGWRQQRSAEHLTTDTREDFERQSPSGSSITDYSQPSSADISGLSSSQTSLHTDDTQYWTESTDKPKRDRKSPATALSGQQVSSSTSDGIGSDSISRTNEQSASSSSDQQADYARGFKTHNHLESQASGSSLGTSNNVFGLADDCTLVSESLRTVKQGPAECPSLANDLQRLRTALVQHHLEIQRSGLNVAIAQANQIHTFGQQLQGLSACIRHSQVQSTPLPPMVVRQCQIQARLLLRSLCATINSLDTQRNRSTGSYGPSNFQQLTSGHDLQLFVPSRGGHVRDRHLQSRAATGVGSLYTGDSIAQDGRFAPPESHAIRMADEERRYVFAFYKDAYEGAFAPGVSSRVVVDAPTLHHVLTKPIIMSDTDGYLETFRDGRTNIAREMESEQREVQEQTQTDRVAQSLPTDLTFSLRSQAKAYEQDTVSRDSISQTPTITAVVLAVLALAVVMTITKTPSLALILPLTALALCTSRQHLRLAALLTCLALLATFGSGLGLDPLRNVCQQLTDLKSFASVARLALCAALVAKPPSSATGTRAVATMLSFFGVYNNECCGGAGVEAYTQSPVLTQRRLTTRERRPQWLGMVDHLTPVAA